MQKLGLPSNSLFPSHGRCRTVEVLKSDSTKSNSHAPAKKKKKKLRLRGTVVVYLSKIN